MALIKCSECGKEVSDKAKSCPNCGNLINEQVNEKFLKENQNKVSTRYKKNFEKYYNELDKNNPQKELNKFTFAMTLSIIIPVLGLYYYFDFKGKNKTKMANDILWICIASPIIWFMIIFIITSME